MSLVRLYLTLMAVLMAALLSGEHKAQLEELSCLDLFISVISCEALTILILLQLAPFLMFPILFLSPPALRAFRLSVRALPFSPG